MKNLFSVRVPVSRFVLPLLGAAALALSSCASTDMMAKAQGVRGPLDPPNQPPTKPNPGYYFLIPVVLPFDIATLPIQFVYLHSRTQPVYLAAPQPQAQPER